MNRFYPLKNISFKKAIVSVILSAFFISSLTPVPLAQAQILPVPGTMLTPSNAFAPAMMVGLTIHPENPLQFDFIIDQGEEPLDDVHLEGVSKKLINYFLAALTVPDDQLWVNLSPYEKDRIIAEDLSVTEMGRDMLAQDYLLKQLTASLMYPETELGQTFWQRVRAKAFQRFGTADVPTNTFNKIWIVPEYAHVMVRNGSVFVVKSHLNVMLEEDYLALEGHNAEKKGPPDEMDVNTKEIIREVLIPEIEKEINQGKNFANLRQIYNSMILATWYKKNLRQSLLGEIYMDQNLVKGIDHVEPSQSREIYNQYLKAFQVGVFDYIKEEADPVTNETIPRKYFSGGLKNINAAQIAEVVRAPSDFAMNHMDGTYKVRTDLAMIGDEEISAKSSQNYYDATADPAMVGVFINIKNLKPDLPNQLQQPIVINQQPLTFSIKRPFKLRNLANAIYKLNKGKISFLQSMALARGKITDVRLDAGTEILLPITTENVQDVESINSVGLYRFGSQDEQNNGIVLKEIQAITSRYVKGISIRAGESIDLNNGVIRDKENQRIGIALIENQEKYKRFAVNSIGQVELKRKGNFDGEDYTEEQIIYNLNQDGRLQLGNNLLKRSFLIKPDQQWISLYGSMSLWTDKSNLINILFEFDAQGRIKIKYIENRSTQTVGIIPPGARALDIQVDEIDGKLEIKWIGRIQIDEEQTIVIDVKKHYSAQDINTGDKYRFEENVSKGMFEWTYKDPRIETDFNRARLNGWKNLDEYPKALHTRNKASGTIDMVGIDASDIVLVHRTDYFPENGIIKTVASATKGKVGRDTIHFTPNHVAPNLSSFQTGNLREGNWDNKKYTILVPLISIPKERMLGFDNDDIFVHGDVILTESATILGVESESKLLKQHNSTGKARYIQAQQSGGEGVSVASSEKMIKDLGYFVVSDIRIGDFGVKENLSRGKHDGHWINIFEEFWTRSDQWFAMKDPESEEVILRPFTTSIRVHDHQALVDDLSYDQDYINGALVHKYAREVRSIFLSGKAEELYNKNIPLVLRKRFGSYPEALNYQWWHSARADQSLKHANRSLRPEPADGAMVEKSEVRDQDLDDAAMTSKMSFEEYEELIRGIIPEANKDVEGDLDGKDRPPLTWEDLPLVFINRMYLFLNNTFSLEDFIQSKRGEQARKLIKQTPPAFDVDELLTDAEYTRYDLSGRIMDGIVRPDDFRDALGKYLEEKLSSIANGFFEEDNKHIQFLIIAVAHEWAKQFPEDGQADDAMSGGEEVVLSTQIVDSKTDAARQNPGGIDFNPINMDLLEDGERMDFQVDPAMLPRGPIQGLRPVILQITPVTGLPLLLGVSENEPAQKFTDTRFKRHRDKFIRLRPPSDSSFDRASFLCHSSHS